jgi:hypothetical protein
MEYEITEKTNEDNKELENIVRQNWGSDKIVTKGKLYEIPALKGVLVKVSNEII